MEKEKSKKKIIWIIIFIISVIVFLTTLILILAKNFGLFNHNLPEVLSTDTDNDTSDQEITEIDNRPENPVDFEKLQSINEDIYAWLSIPSCDIEYLIIQPQKDDDLYYLRRNIYREYEFSGTIFTEKLNSKAFDDANTVIYGHNMLDGTMFSNLLKFKDEQFFNENEEFYIYLPGVKLTYKIFSAYQYDDRHLLNSFDLSNPEILADYFEEASHPKVFGANTREVGLTTDDKIVTLSTCTGANWDYRYLVQGVLINYESTKQ